MLCEQDAAVGEELVSVNSMLGCDNTGMTVGVPESVRLFVSPVVPPFASQVGAAGKPSASWILTTRVVGLVKLAKNLQQSPTTLNSVSVQAFDRSSALGSEYAPPLPLVVTSLTVSFAPAVAFMTRPGKSAEVRGGWTGAAGPLNTQFSPFCCQLWVGGLPCAGAQEGNAWATESVAVHPVLSE